MKKKLISILTAGLFIFCVGCGDTTDETTARESTASAENETATDLASSTEGEASNESDAEPDKNDADVESESVPDENELCREALEAAQIELLSIYHQDYETAEINGYGVSSDAYDEATILTIGLKLPDSESFYYWKGTTVSGETASDTDGNPVVQTFYNTAWNNADKDYLLFVIRCGGNIDPSRAQVTLKGTGDVTVEKALSESGESIGFSSALAAFSMDTATSESVGCDSWIVKLAGRHYYIVRRYISSDGFSGGSSGDFDTCEESYVLIPLEEGLQKSLTNDDVEISLSELPETITVEAEIGGSYVDASTLNCQTVLTAIVKRRMVEPTDENGRYPDEAWDNSSADIDQAFEATQFIIDDGDGNAVTLKF